MLDRQADRTITKRTGVTLFEARVLGVIFHTEPTTVLAVSRLLGADKGQTSRRINNLEKLGYLARVPHPDDNRSMLLTLTEQGRAAIQRWMTKAQERNAALVSILDEQELDTLDRAIDKLTEYARARLVEEEMDGE